jgi:hypothetical protein
MSMKISVTIVSEPTTASNGPRSGNDLSLPSSSTYSVSIVYSTSIVRRLTQQFPVHSNGDWEPVARPELVPRRHCAPQVSYHDRRHSSPTESPHRGRERVCVNTAFCGRISTTRTESSSGAWPSSGPLSRTWMSTRRHSTLLVFYTTSVSQTHSAPRRCRLRCVSRAKLQAVRWLID